MRRDQCAIIDADALGEIEESHYESLPPPFFVWCSMCRAEPLEPCRWTFGAGKKSRWEVHNDRREGWIQAGRPTRPVRKSRATPKAAGQRRLFL